jgi:hypothetical protein
LWTAGIEGSLVPQYLPHETLAEGCGLSVALAFVGAGSLGKLRFTHVTSAKVRDEGWNFKEMLDRGRGNLTDGLRIDASETAQGTMLTLHRSGTPAAGALALHDLHRNVAQILGGTEFLVGVPSIFELMIARSDQPIGSHVRTATASAGPIPPWVVPTVLALNADGLRLVDEHRP